MAKAAKAEKPNKTQKTKNAENVHAKNDSASDSQDESKRQRKQQKQQAKQDAKLMLKIEDAKKDVEKAQQKVIKAQAALNKAQEQLHSLEEKMSSQQVVALLPPVQEEQHNTSVQATNGATPESDSATTNTSVPTEQVVSQPPAEGRSDISEQPQTVQTPSNTPAQSLQEDNQKIANAFDALPPEDTRIESDNVSMPILTQDEHAWPPPETREEVAEAVFLVETGGENNAGDAQTLHSEEHHETASAGHTDDSQNTQLTEHYGSETHQQE